MQPLHARRLQIRQRVDPIRPPLFRLERVSPPFVVLLDLLVRGHVLSDDEGMVDHETARGQEGHDSQKDVGTEQKLHRRARDRLTLLVHD